MTKHAKKQPIPVVTVEPAVVRIAKAMAALVNALPETRSISVSSDHGAPYVLIQTSDEGVRDLAATLGCDVVETGHEGRRWIAAAYDRADIEIRIMGPHRDVSQPIAIDEPRVTAALSQAEAAL
jgi:hypothetical protein